MHKTKPKSRFLGSAMRRPTQSQITAFLNSPFGLWCLSTLVIGGLSWGYARWDMARTERQQHGEHLERLKLETWTRIQDLKNFRVGALSQMATRLRDNDSPDAISDAVAAIVACTRLTDAPGKGGARGLFSDFKDRDLISLLRELEYYLPDDEKKSVRETLDQAFQLDTANRELLSPIAAVRNSGTGWLWITGGMAQVIDKMSAHPRWDDPDHPYRPIHIPTGLELHFGDPPDSRPSTQPWTVGG